MDEEACKEAKKRKAKHAECGLAADVDTALIYGGVAARSSGWACLGRRGEAEAVIETTTSVV